MAIFGLFKKKAQNPWDIDYISVAEEFETAGDFTGAIAEYEKIIKVIYVDKPAKSYKHLTKKIIDCYLKLGNYEKVIELWPLKYDPTDYGPKEIYDLIKILEIAQRNDLIMQVFNQAGKKLLPNKIEFLIKQKRIPEANALLNELLVNAKESTQGIENLWMTKAKLCLSLMKWEEANRFLDKILEKNNNNAEARKLKTFCISQLRK
jgi:tetratricopeptide (TPR) repeat protein